MRITTLCEEGLETRVAITPKAVKAYTELKCQVILEQHAGIKSGFRDEDYRAQGAHVGKSPKTLVKETDIILCVNEPNYKKLAGLPPHSLIIGHIDKDPKSPLITWCLKEKISLLSMNLIPRISRAQSMDSLSSQSNLAGYKAVLEGVSAFHKAVPMMMTAAGMIQPAKILILGAGVAGLQAIATAKRLGAVVYAFDVRTAAKEQVESLGAEFIEVSSEKDSETQAGYASETSADYQKKQAELISQYAQMADIVISTALIPDRQAPVLLHKKTVELMKPGSIIVDLATSKGGNCELSVEDKTIEHQGVTIIGTSNLARLVPVTASDLYANNLVNLTQTIVKDSILQLNPEDSIIQQAVLCHDGCYLPFQKIEESNHA